MSILKNIMRFFGSEGEDAGGDSKVPSTMENKESEKEIIDVSNLSSDDSLKALSKILEEANFDAVMIGAFAMGAHNYARVTSDIDFMVEENNLLKIDEALSRIGYQRILKTPQHAKYQNKENKNFIDVDVVFVEEESLNRIVEKAEVKIARGAEFLIAPLEIVLATKLHAIQHNNARRQGKDVLDVFELLKMNEIDIDGKWFISLCEKYGGSEMYDDHFAKVENKELAECEEK